MGSFFTLPNLSQLHYIHRSSKHSSNIITYNPLLSSTLPSQWQRPRIPRLLASPRLRLQKPNPKQSQRRLHQRSMARRHQSQLSRPLPHPTASLLTLTLPATPSPRLRSRSQLPTERPTARPMELPRKSQLPLPIAMIVTLPPTPTLRRRASQLPSLRMSQRRLL